MNMFINKTDYNLILININFEITDNPIEQR